MGRDEGYSLEKFSWNGKGEFRGGLGSGVIPWTAGKTGNIRRKMN